MNYLPFRLLNDRDTFWGLLWSRRLSGSELLRLMVFIMVACGVYGAIMAGWRSPRLSLYVAIKLPLLFLATTAFVSVFNWMLGLVFRTGLDFRTTIWMVFSAMTLASWILISLAPVSLLFMLSGVPALGTEAELQYAHNGILVTHILVLALSGVSALWVLREGLVRLAAPGCPVGLVLLTWIGMFAFVGCQMGWILRPFVGSPFYPVAFMRPDCLERNFYEFVFGEVMPYLLQGGR